MRLTERCERGAPPFGKFCQVLFYLFLCQHDPAPLFIAGYPILQDMLYPIVFQVIFIFCIFNLL
jgi:hypothetical protein